MGEELLNTPGSNELMKVKTRSVDLFRGMFMHSHYVFRCDSEAVAKSVDTGPSPGRLGN